MKGAARSKYARRSPFVRPDPGQKTLSRLDGSTPPGIARLYPCTIRGAGRGAAWQRACFGSRRSAVRIRPPRPAGRWHEANVKLTAQQVTDAADIAERWIRLRAMMQDVPGVSYGITHAGRTVRRGALGVSDLDTGQPATPDDGTCYRIASISKTVTATLTMQLVERGRLRLDDPVSAHLPW